jgi:hypothetical protein
MLRNDPTSATRIIVIGNYCDEEKKKELEFVSLPTVCYINLYSWTVMILI